MNDLSQGYQVSGIGIDKAEALIVEAVFNNYLDGTTSYSQIRTAMLAAADAVFCDYDWANKTITDAWYAVGVGSAFSGTLASISGSNIVCTTENYSVSNLPAGTSVTWSSTNPSILSINSSTGVATKVASGNVTIIADIAGGCGSFRIVKDVFSGTPDHNKFYVRDAIIGSLPIILDNYGTIYVRVSYQDDPLLLSGISQYEWDVPNGTVTQSTFFQIPAMNEVDVFYANGSYPSTHQVYLRAQNTCGWSQWDEMIWQVDNSFFFAYTIFPNPAKDKLTMEFEKADRKEGIPNSISLLNENSAIPIQKVDVWSKYQRGEIVNNQIVLDVSSLPRGKYFLHLQYEGEKSEVKMHQIILH